MKMGICFLNEIWELLSYKIETGFLVKLNGNCLSTRTGFLRN